jgi:hypothetical protein
MSKNILITLVSDQAIPNVQYFKEFKPNNVLFFTSQKMADKIDNISKVFKEINPNVIIDSIKSDEYINEDDYLDIISKIDKKVKSLKIDLYDEIIVNATLGTKIMSLALCDYFKNKQNTKILYTPIGKNKFKSVFDQTTDKEFSDKVTFVEYFRSYGVKIKSYKPPLKSFEYTKSFLSYYLEFNSDDIKIVEFLRDGSIKNEKGEKKLNYRKNGVKKVMDIDGLASFLEKIKYEYKDNKLTKNDVEYLTGNWFEEWTYFHLKEKYNLDDNQIGLGVFTSLFAENDLDVVYLLNNNLYVVECKTRINKQLMESTLYKSGALIDKFGRAATSLIFTLEDFSLMQEGQRNSIVLRATQQKITIKEKNDVLKLNF